MRAAEQTARPTANLRTVDLVYIAFFAALMAVCSWLSVPATVEFTMQTFAIFLALSVLGGRRGFGAIAVFVALGAVGAPVFANFTGGLGVLLGSTGGYILGFLALGLVYWGVTDRFGRSLRVEVAALVLGMAVCYAFGTAWFMLVYLRETGPVGFVTALLWCVVPFVPFDLLKMALALGLSGRLRRCVK